MTSPPGRVTPGRWDRKGLWGKARSRWVRALAPNDQVVEWYKPYVRPKWLTRDEYAALPKLLRVREALYGGPARVPGAECDPGDRAAGR